ncbi:MAG: hypothetical protein QOI24_2525 [Acidobacteriota bacterium]|nr:hypothetical protein [Acidobacteriota bacterium]
MLACANEPRRPASVSPAAEWAGGSDGGSWIDCGQITKEPVVAFRCTMWSEAGDVVARGEFVHARFAGGKWVAIGSLFTRLDYSSYDGDVIHLSGRRALIPDGDIDHPFNAQHGKRTTYALDVRVREIEY